MQYQNKYHNKYTNITNIGKIRMPRSHPTPSYDTTVKNCKTIAILLCGKKGKKLKNSKAILSCLFLLCCVGTIANYMIYAIWNRLFFNSNEPVYYKALDLKHPDKWVNKTLAIEINKYWGENTIVHRHDSKTLMTSYKIPFFEYYKPIIEKIHGTKKNPLFCNEAHSITLNNMKKRVNIGKVPILLFDSNIFITDTEVNNNWCHAVNDKLLPMFAAINIIRNHDENIVPLVFATNDGRLLNCGINSGSDLSINLQELLSITFQCEKAKYYVETVLQQHDVTIKDPQDMMGNYVCSENVYHINEKHWDKWWRLWSANINAGYNWHRYRYIPFPSKHGRNEMAVSLYYHHMSYQIRQRLCFKCRFPFISDINIHHQKHRNKPYKLTFANRKKRRRIINVAEIIKKLNYNIALLENFKGLSSKDKQQNYLLDIDTNVLYFEDNNLCNIGKRLALTKILITPHGANMANMIFLPTNSIVIEILPYRCQRLRVFFLQMATAIGIKYMSIQPSVSSQVPGLADKNNVNGDNDIENSLFNRRDKDLEQCDRDQWEYMNFNIEPDLVWETIMAGLI